MQQLSEYQSPKIRILAKSELFRIWISMSYDLSDHLNSGLDFKWRPGPLANI